MMAKKQYTLDDKIELIVREMCRDLGINVEDLDIRKRYNVMVREELEKDSLHIAKEKFERGRLGNNE